MDWWQALIYYCFVLLTKLGLRQTLVRQFAYFPPLTPSYVFRPTRLIDPDDSFSSQDELLQIESVRHCGSLGEENLRFHRASSLLSDRAKISQFQSKKSKTHDEHIIQAKLATIPLRKPFNKAGYEIRLVTSNKIALNLCPPEDIEFIGYYLKSSAGDIIACVHLQLTNAHSDYIILHSHGNSSDLGKQLDSYLDLCYNLGVDVLGYDYPGFGQSTGSTDDIQAISAAETAYNFVTKDLNYEPSKVILYGQSVGSGPSVMLASNPAVLIGGLIIHSGFLSGLKVMCPQAPCNTQDIFPNEHYINAVNCLVLILHGTLDKVVGYEQAEELAKRTKNLHKLWLVLDGGHNDIEINERFRENFFQTLRSYMNTVRDNLLSDANRASYQSESFKHIYKQQIQTIITDEQTPSRGSQKLEMYTQIINARGKSSSSFHQDDIINRHQS